MLIELENWQQVEWKIHEFLSSELGLQDCEPFQEYILQLIHPSDLWDQDQQEDKEIFEIINEFLSEAGSGSDDHSDKINEFVSQLLEWKRQLLDLQKEEKMQRQDVEKQIQRLKSINVGDGSFVVDPSLQPLLVETRTSTQKKQVSRQERLEREQMLAKYGYELEELVEKDGETEIVYKAKEKTVDPLLSLSQSNSEIIREKLRMQKQQQKEKHEKEKKRNKELLEKQKLEKELKKNGTQKREKQRR